VGKCTGLLAAVAGLLAAAVLLAAGAVLPLLPPQAAAPIATTATTQGAIAPRLPHCQPLAPGAEEPHGLVMLAA
jgi:hypothetical protein